jgi:protein-disulfide isomerase
MPSGKQSKRRRRAASAPAAPVRQASPRVLVAAAALVLAITAGVVLGRVPAGRTTKASLPAHGSLVGAPPGAADVQQLLRGIQQHGNVLGSLAAPVTMVVYLDLQCPYCRQFETEAMPTLVSRYVRARTLKVEVRPIAFVGPDSVRGRTAMLAAGRQNRLFDFTQLLYVNQGAENTGWLSEAMIESTAAGIPGLDLPLLLRDRSSSAHHRPGSRARRPGDGRQHHRHAHDPRRQKRRSSPSGDARVADRHTLAVEGRRHRSPLTAPARQR